MNSVTDSLKGAIFDMDGTLVDSLMLWDIIWERLGEKFLGDRGFKPTEKDDKIVRTSTLKDAMQHIHNVYKIGGSGDSLHAEAKDIMIKFYSEEVKLKDGVAEFLEYCKKKGVKMCIASATEISLIEIAAKHCGIEKYFDKIFSCAGIGKGKDKPDIYLMALDYLGTKKEESCVFEDSHIAIQTADSIGMKTVGIYDKYNFGHEEMKKIATVYIDKNETLEKLI